MVAAGSLSVVCRGPPRASKRSKGSQAGATGGPPAGAPLGPPPPSGGPAQKRPERSERGEVLSAIKQQASRPRREASPLGSVCRGNVQSSTENCARAMRSRSEVRLRGQSRLSCDCRRSSAGARGARGAGGTRGLPEGQPFAGQRTVAPAFLPHRPKGGEAPPRLPDRALESGRRACAGRVETARRSSNVRDEGGPTAAGWTGFGVCGDMDQHEPAPRPRPLRRGHEGGVKTVGKPGR